MQGIWLPGVMGTAMAPPMGYSMPLDLLEEMVLHYIEEEKG